MDAVLEGRGGDPVPEDWVALFRFLSVAAKDTHEVAAEDLDAARDAGWTDEALYDAITVCSLFRFYNTWIDAAGVHDLPPEAYEQSGKRMAGGGYA